MSQSYSVVTDGMGHVQSKTPTSSSSAPVSHGSRLSSSVNSNNQLSDSRTSPNGWKQAGSQEHKLHTQNGGGDSGHSLRALDKGYDFSAISGQGLEKDDMEQEDVFLDPLEPKVPTFFSNLDPRYE